MPKKNGMIEKHLVFCYAYIANNFNVTKAAYEAGYKGNKATAASWGSKLISKNPLVRKKIEELTERYISQIDLRAADVIKEITLLAFRRMSDYVDIDPVTRQVVVKTLEEIGEKDAAIQRIKVKQRCALTGENVEPGKEYSVIDSDIDITLCDKIKPLEMLANYLHLIKTKSEEGDSLERVEEVDLSNLTKAEIKELIKVHNKAAQNNPTLLIPIKDEIN